MISSFVFQGIPPKGQSPNQYRQWAVDINSLVEDKVSQFPNCHFHRMDPSLFVKEDGKQIYGENVPSMTLFKVDFNKRFFSR